MEANYDSPFSKISAPVTKHILSYLTEKKNLAAALLVNKEWSSLVKEIFNEMVNHPSAPSMRVFQYTDSPEITTIEITYLGEIYSANIPTPSFADGAAPVQTVVSLKNPSGKTITIHFKPTPLTTPGCPPLPKLHRPEEVHYSTEAQHINALGEFNASQQPLHLSIYAWNITSQPPVPIKWHHPHTVVPHNSRIAIEVFNAHQVLRVKVVSGVVNSQQQSVPLEPNNQPDIKVTQRGNSFGILNPREMRIMMVFTARYPDSPLGLHFVSIPDKQIPNVPFKAVLTLNVHPPEPTDDNCELKEKEAYTAEKESIENPPAKEETTKNEKEEERSEPIENAEAPEKEKDADEKEGKEKLDI